MSDAGRSSSSARSSSQSGRVLPNAKLVYRTYGTLAPDRSNVVLYPTSYGAQHTDIEWLIEPDGILDPTRYFVVIVNMFGNGLSTSPSHLAEARLRGHSPRQRRRAGAPAARALRHRGAGARLRLVDGRAAGLSLGGAVPASACGGSRRCAEPRARRAHNLVFLKSLEAALHGRSGLGRHALHRDARSAGIRAFARIYASWAASQAFYREGSTASSATRDLEDYLGARLGGRATAAAIRATCSRCCAPGWRATFRTIRGTGAISTRRSGSIRARTLVMPSATDLYFTPEDCAADAAAHSAARGCSRIPSIWGHRAGNPYQNPEDARFIRDAIDELLAD